MDDLMDYLGSYLIGSIPVAYLLMKIFKQKVVRKRGSGTVNFAAVWKEAGVPWGVLALVLDILKGAAAVFMAHKLSPTDPPDMVAAGFLVLMGDEFPVFSKFKGSRSLGVLVGVFGALLYCMLVK